MDCPKISVIVAVYKAEAYLHRCVDSLLAQTFQDFEILLIDDGSPDNSGKICDDYAKQDARIRVFHKENGGVGSARQCGIDHARGEYTTHVDSDDWVEPTMLEDLYRKAKEEDADMVLSDFYLEYRDNIKYEKQQPSSLKIKSILLDLLVNDKLRVSLCGRLIRLFCYKDNNIKFPLHLKYGEDDCALIKLICKMRKISYLPYAYYHYDQYSNQNSLTRTVPHPIIERMSIYNCYRTDIHNITPWGCNTYWAYMVYDLFKENQVSASKLQEEFRKDIPLFLCSYASIKVKFFIILSAMGYKDIAYKMYEHLKNIYRTIFPKAEKKF